VTVLRGVTVPRPVRKILKSLLLAFSTMTGIALPFAPLESFFGSFFCEQFVRKTNSNNTGMMNLKFRIEITLLLK
jgi:hypothetical protein